MSKHEILTKAINLAIEGGWIDGTAALSEVKSIPAWAIPTPVCIAIIFNQDFAKALWRGWKNESELSLYPGAVPEVSKWQYHLQQMVVDEDPIKYLGDNI